MQLVNVRIRTVTVAAGLVVLAGWLVGCQSSPGVEMAAARAAFEAGDFETAYRGASRVARSGDTLKTEAAYLAGVSAYRLGKPGNAERYLLVAAKGAETPLKGDTLAMLGLVYVAQDRYDRASQALVSAASRLSGQDRANAYFHAANAEQRLQRWANARAYLTLARSISSDEVFRQRAAEQLRHTGWTVQLASFANEADAVAAAAKLATDPRVERLGAPTVAQTIDSDGEQKYVVRCGQFSIFATAAAERRQLGMNSAVVMSIPMR